MRERKDDTEDPNKGAGIDYDAMDPFKRACQKAAQTTSGNVERLGVRVLEWTRGESAFVFQLPGGALIAHTQEGLGTKNLVAEAMGPRFNRAIAQDTAAMILNDIATVGAMPISLAMHLATGNGDWFKDEERTTALIEGFTRSCNLAGCVWGGGETCTLPQIVEPHTAELSGSATGLIRTETCLVNATQNVRADLQIILFGSSGIHANGLSAARKIAAELREGYRTKLPSGRTYGEALLDPTVIYVELMRRLQDLGVWIAAAVNITGHGWRKLMRPLKPMTYVIDRVPEPQEVFRFMQTHRRFSEREMYGTFNMGAGFAVYVEHMDVALVLKVAEDLGIPALHAGHTEDGPRQVIIKPKENLTFDSSTLKIS